MDKVEVFEDYVIIALNIFYILEISSDFKIEESVKKPLFEVNKKSVNIRNLRFLFTHVTIKGNNTNVLFLHYRKTLMLFFVDGRKLIRLLSTKN